MIKDEIISITKKIEELVLEAFYCVYLKVDSNWCYCENITVGLSDMEDEIDLPLISVDIHWGQGSEVRFEKEVMLDLTKSREFLLGYIVANMEEAED